MVHQQYLLFLITYCSLLLLSLATSRTIAATTTTTTTTTTILQSEPQKSASSQPRKLSSFPSSCNPNESSIPATADQRALQSIRKSNPNDGYMNWMLNTGDVDYRNSVYIPTSSNECIGIGFHWTIVRPDDDEQSTSSGTILMAAAVKLDSIEAATATATATATAKGWMAIGFSETGGMRGADVVYFTFNEFTTPSANLVDGHILDTLVKPTPDPQQDWTLVGHTFTNDGYLIFEAKRGLVTDDQTYDRPFVDDSSLFVQDHKVIGAWGSGSDSLSYHGNNRVHTSIQLFPPKQNGLEGSLEPGLFYENFRREMDTRSDGSIVMNTNNYEVPLAETTYHEECHEHSDLINVNSALYVIGYEFLIQPAMKKYLHHIVVYGHPHGCNQGWRWAPFIGWTPGDEFLYFPQNTGMKVGGADGFKSFTLQYHFDNRDLDPNLVDTGSGVRVYFTRETVRDEIGMMQVGDPNVGLKGQSVGQGLTRHVFSCPSSCTSERFVTDEITVVKEQLHMHTFGQRIVDQIVRDGVVVHESSLDYWDFDQIGTASPQIKPFKVKRGDTFRTVCYYRAQEDIKFGLGSQDEMCMSFILYFPKQPFDTCTVDHFDPLCRTNYEGRYDLESTHELMRKFGDPAVSNQVCTDSLTYTFGTYKYGTPPVTVVRDCNWLGDSSPENNVNRIKKWCDEIVDGRRVSDKCPRACLTCADPPLVEIGAPSVRPSLVSSRIPSTQPTSAPTFAPTSAPTSAPVKASDSPMTTTSNPTSVVSSTPTFIASPDPTIISSESPTSTFSANPSDYPSKPPTNAPTVFQSATPSSEHSFSPSNFAIPTMYPSPRLSAEPTKTISTSPLSSPSEPPTMEPSKPPSFAPTYSKQSFELFITMEFDSLSQFDGKARKTFEKETDFLLKTVLDMNGDDFNVFTSINGFEEIKEDQSRRTLFRSGLSRALENPSGLRIFMDIFVDVRSGTRFTSDGLSEVILTALDEEGE